MPAQTFASLLKGYNPNRGAGGRFGSGAKASADRHALTRVAATEDARRLSDRAAQTGSGPAHYNAMKAHETAAQAWAGDPHTQAYHASRAAQHASAAATANGDTKSHVTAGRLHDQAAASYRASADAHMQEGHRTTMPGVKNRLFAMQDAASTSARAHEHSAAQHWAVKGPKTPQLGRPTADTKKFYSPASFASDLLELTAAAQESDTTDEVLKAQVQELVEAFTGSEPLEKNWDKWNAEHKGDRSEGHLEARLAAHSKSLTEHKGAYAGKLTSSNKIFGDAYHARQNGDTALAHEHLDRLEAHAGFKPGEARKGLSVLKVDEDQHMVWGWASVSVEKGQEVHDLQGDCLATHELQGAVHDFMENERVGKEMHAGSQIGTVVDSIVFTKAVQDALGIDLGREGWYVGVKVSDDKVWKRVKSGELKAFSIGGSGERNEVLAKARSFNDLVNKAKKPTPEETAALARESSGPIPHAPGTEDVRAKMIAAHGTAHAHLTAEQSVSLLKPRSKVPLSSDELEAHNAAHEKAGGTRDQAAVDAELDAESRDRQKLGLEKAQTFGELVAKDWDKWNAEHKGIKDAHAGIAGSLERGNSLHTEVRNHLKDAKSAHKDLLAEKDPSKFSGHIARMQSAHDQIRDTAKADFDDHNLRNVRAHSADASRLAGRIGRGNDYRTLVNRGH